MNTAPVTLVPMVSTGSPIVDPLDLMESRVSDTFVT